MIINIAIKGGLGNQLFQYALGSYLKQNHNATVFYDSLPLSAEEKNLTRRSFLLDKLFTDVKRSKRLTHSLFHTQINSRPVKLLKKLFRVVNRYVYVPEANPFTLQLQNNNTYYFDGYWQRADLAACIIRLTNTHTHSILKNNPYQTLINAAGETVAVHIRRGDYVNNAFINEYHGHCDINYYTAAMQYLEDKINVSSYFIFSDDLAWAKANITSKRDLVFVEGDTNEPVTDLFLMKSCRHQVISNSSFSCWSSYLNQNPDKIVIAPASWTRKDKTKDLPLFDHTWTLI